MNKQINQYRKYERIEGEVIRVIKLDIRIDDIVLNDQFEWDINNPDNSPDEFAIALCADLGLGSIFILPIAHSIKEQILDYQKVYFDFICIVIIRNYNYNYIYNL
jgi:SWI/SNF-related matrix-associated actin-dependent regulator of chromatin subfamily B protein 1